MTVQELIVRLLSLSDEQKAMDIVYNDYECGHSQITTIKQDKNCWDGKTQNIVLQ